MKVKGLILTAVAVLSMSACAFAADVALTSVGQSPDAMMVKMVLKRIHVEPDFDSMMKPTALTNQKVFIAVVGGSSKGLGAAGIDKDAEVARAKSLFEAAKAKNMKILVMHVGGEGRRGTLSDEFVNCSAPYADKMIIVEGGNKDEIFTKLGAAKKAEILGAAKVADTKDPLKTVLDAWGAK